MGLSSDTPRWTRHIFYRSQHIRTTWKLRVGIVALVLLLGWLTRDGWTAGIARSLVCDANAAPSDAILIENFDPNYLVFERATKLRRAGLATRVLVPVAAGPEASGTNAVALAVAEATARIARLGEMDIVPIREVEPISLNAARDVLGYLDREGIRSVIVVTPIFRSRRSTLVYSATFGVSGVAVTCEPVQGTRGVETWADSWHGIQNVGQQWLKLQYYRFYVLPFRS